MASEYDGRILVIDDEEMLRMMVQDVLQAEGYTVDTAADGEEGLEMIRQNRYQLVITDNNMPGIEGLEVIRQAKVHDPEMALILMTAYGTVDTSIKAHELGATGYLLKPFEDIDEIVKEVKRVIAKQERELEFKRKTGP